MLSNHDANSPKTVVIYLVLAYMIKPDFEDPVESAGAKAIVLLISSWLLRYIAGPLNMLLPIFDLERTTQPRLIFSIMSLYGLVT